MVTITTKTLPATDHHGTRIKATSYRGSTTIPWDHAHDTYENHRAAAIALLVRKHTPGPPAKFPGYKLPDGNSHAFVFIVED
jgi:hypothetical protein